VIFKMCFACLFVQQDAVFKQNHAMLGFPVSPGNAEALIRLSGKVICVLLTYCLSNSSAKDCQIPFTYIEIIT